MFWHHAIDCIDNSPGERCSRLADQTRNQHCLSNVRPLGSLMLYVPLRRSFLPELSDRRGGASSQSLHVPNDEVDHPPGAIHHPIEVCDGIVHLDDTRAPFSSRLPILCDFTWWPGQPSYMNAFGEIQVDNNGMVGTAS